MPKIKTKRGAAKRIHKSSKGRVYGYKSGGSHLLSKKNRSRKRSYKEKHFIEKADRKRIRRMLPNS